MSFVAFNSQNTLAGLQLAFLGRFDFSLIDIWFPENLLVHDSLMIFYLFFAHIELTNKTVKNPSKGSVTDISNTFTFFLTINCSNPDLICDVMDSFIRTVTGSSFKNFYLAYQCGTSQSDCSIHDSVS